MRELHTDKKANLASTFVRFLHVTELACYSSFSGVQTRMTTCPIYRFRHCRTVVYSLHKVS